MTDRRSPYPLYNPADEHDGYGTGFVAQIDGARSHRIVELAVQAVVNLTHRGAISADAASGDGASVTIVTIDRAAGHPGIHRGAR